MARSRASMFRLIFATPPECLWLSYAQYRYCDRLVRLAMHLRLVGPIEKTDVKFGRGGGAHYTPAHRGDAPHLYPSAGATSRRATACYKRERRPRNFLNRGCEHVACVGEADPSL
jgi:hypothetical protein